MLIMNNKWVKNNKISDKDKHNKQNVIKIKLNKNKQLHQNKNNQYNHKKLHQRKNLQHKN